MCLSNRGWEKWGREVNSSTIAALGGKKKTKHKTDMSYTERNMLLFQEVYNYSRKRRNEADQVRNTKISYHPPNTSFDPHFT